MLRPKFAKVLLVLVCCGALAGCGANFHIGTQNPPGDSPVVLTMTDTPPAGITLLSAQATLTRADLNPGAFSLLPPLSNSPLLGSTTLELTRLQTDTAYLSTTLVKAGSYTSLTLTFANPKLTFENDSPTTFTGATCSGKICSLSPTVTNMTTTLTLPTITVSSTSGAGILVDLNLNNLLSSPSPGALQADFMNGTSVSTFTPAGFGAPLVGAEDVAGQVTAVDTGHSKFSFQNALDFFSLTVNSTTAFLNFPAGTCTTPSLSCLQTGQILSVDIGVGSDGTAIARNVLFEDANSTDAEVEGIITSLIPASHQFTMVTLTESAALVGLNVGDLATVHYPATLPPVNFFDVDFLHADNNQINTAGFVFGSAADLLVGQQVQVRRNPSSSGASITADRVQLRSSRVTGTITNGPMSNFQMGGLPTLFTTNSISQIQVQTSPPTICTGTAASCPLLGVNKSVSVRGPFFANAGTPTVIASKVIQH